MVRLCLSDARGFWGSLALAVPGEIFLSCSAIETRCSSVFGPSTCFGVKADVFEKIFDAVSDDLDMANIIINGTIVRVPMDWILGCGQGEKGGLRARPSAGREAG